MGIHRADAASSADLGRLPNGKINGFRQVVGKIKCHFMRRFVEEGCREVERRFERGSGTDVTHQAAARAVATAVAVVAGAVVVGMLVCGIV